MEIVLITNPKHSCMQIQNRKIHGNYVLTNFTLSMRWTEIFNEEFANYPPGVIL
jgi:hypothetical protein